MKKQSLAVLAAVGITAAIAIPSIAFGNARRTDPNGTLSYLRDAQTPFIAQLTGPAELTGTTPTGDPDGVGAASVTFDSSSVTEGQVCLDLAYSKILAPNLAHIHRGAVGAAGPVVVDFGVAGSDVAQWVRHGKCWSCRRDPWQSSRVLRQRAQH